MNLSEFWTLFLVISLGTFADSPILSSTLNASASDMESKLSLTCEDQ